MPYNAHNAHEKKSYAQENAATIDQQPSRKTNRKWMSAIAIVTEA